MSEYTYDLYEYSERYDYATLQRHLSDSQNLMIRRIRHADQCFEKAIEGIEKKDDCPTLCPTLPNLWKPL